VYHDRVVVDGPRWAPSYRRARLLIHRELDDMPPGHRSRPCPVRALRPSATHAPCNTSSYGYATPCARRTPGAVSRCTSAELEESRKPIPAGYGYDAPVVTGFSTPDGDQCRSLGGHVYPKDTGVSWVDGGSEVFEPLGKSGEAEEGIRIGACLVVNTSVVARQDEEDILM
jgi:hypothetical protein